MEKLFEKILDDDEKIIKVMKPHKGKYYFSAFVTWGLCFLFMVACALLPFIFSDDGNNNVAIVVSIVIVVACVFLVWLFASIYYKNLYYAYTNKRVIIRSGIFGVDFKSLDMSMIGAVNVYVSLLDKIIKKDTGSIMFGSTASPIGGQNAGIGYRFNHISMPYETCKEVKSAIDEYKKNNK